MTVRLLWKGLAARSGIVSYDKKGELNPPEHDGHKCKSNMSIVFVIVLNSVILVKMFFCVCFYWVRGIIDFSKCSY